MAEWTLVSVGKGALALEFALVGLPLALALVCAWLVRRARDAAEFDGRRAELSAWSTGLSLGASDLALALGFVVLPFAASQPDGGFVCLQGLLIGGTLGRWIVARWILPACFASRERGATAWIAERLGARAAGLAESAFALGAVCSAAARVFLFAFVLHVALGPSLSAGGSWTGFALLVVALTALAVLLYAVRGLRGAVASDGPLFLALLVAGLAGLIGVVGTLNGGWSVFVEVFLGARRHEVLGFDTSPARPYTLWIAIFVASLGSVAHYGTDPVQLTRLVATGSLERARRALWISLVGVVPAIVLCLIGGGVLAWRERNALVPDAALLVGVRPDALWPAIIARELSPWTRGLALAGFAACAVIAAKSAIAALVQLIGAWRGRRGAAESGIGRLRGRAVLLGLGIALAALGLLRVVGREPALLDVALGTSSYANGLLLAATGLALLRRRTDAEGFLWAAPLALLGVTAIAVHGPRANLVVSSCAVVYLVAWVGWRTLPDWFGYRRRAGALFELVVLLGTLVLLVWAERRGFVAVERHFRYDPEWVWLPLSSPWYVPAGGWIGFVFGCLLARGSAGSEGLARSLAR